MLQLILADRRQEGQVVAEGRRGMVIAPSGVGEVLDLGFNLARRNYRLLLIVAAWGIVPSEVASTLMSLVASGAESPLSASLGLGALGTMISTLGIVLAHGAVALAGARLIVPGDSMDGDDLAPGRLYMSALTVLPRLLLWGVVIAILAVPLLIILPLGVFLSVRWSMSWMVMLVERVGPIAALRRSWALTRGAWWHTAIITFAAALIVGVLTYSILGVFGGAAALSGFAAGRSTLAAVIISIGGMLINLVLTPISMGIAVVLYFELRARTEGFDLEQRALQVTTSA